MRNLRGQFVKGGTGLFKNRKHSQESKDKIRIGHIGKSFSQEHKLKISISNLGKNKGKIKSEETRRKISLSLKGKQTWSKGKIFNQEYRKKLSIARMGYKPTKEHIKSSLARRSKSSLEEKFQKIIDNHNLPYKFVGNGEFIIGRKNPDFININGKKIAIEVFYRRHKEEFRQGVDNWKSERKEIFEKYGWQLLFFDETQVNENEVVKAIS